MSEPARTALIGLDNPHSGGWLTTLQHCPAVGRLVVCSEEECEWVDKHYSSIDTLLAQEPLDFALVSTRNDRAPALAAQLLNSGVPVIVEQPVARSLAEVVELNQVAAEAGRIWATAFMNRCHPIVLKMRELVAAGVLGEIVSIEGRMVTNTVQQRKPEHWLFDRTKAGGGILHWLAIHTVDLIRYISGLEYRSVAAHKATLSGTGIDVEDVLAASFSLENGALGSLHAGYVLPRRYGDIFLCFRGTQGDATWEMYGAGGRAARLTVQSQVGEWADDEYTQLSRSGAAAPGYGGATGLDFIADFIAASRGERDFVTNGEDAQQAMRFVEAAYSAAEEGRQIDL